MSVFWMDGPKVIVPENQIKEEMFEDRIFLPGTLHGGKDYLIRVYLNDVGYEKEPHAFIAELLTRDLILKAHKADPSHDYVFDEMLLEGAENFLCYNNGHSDFAALFLAWPESVVMSNSDLVEWAETPIITEEDVREILEDHIDDVYVHFQKKTGITSGDISPEDAIVQDRLVDELASVITSVLVQELSEKEDPK